MAKKKTNTINVVATKFFNATRFVSLPKDLVTKTEFRALKAGESIALSQAQYEANKYYFEESE